MPLKFSAGNQLGQSLVQGEREGLVSWVGSRIRMECMLATQYALSYHTSEELYTHTSILQMGKQMSPVAKFFAFGHGVN